MTASDTTTTPRGEPAQVRSPAMDKAVTGRKPAKRDENKSRGGFSQLVHKSPETYNPPSVPESGRQ